MSDLISREALCEYALNQKDKSITPNDIMRFPSAQPKKRTEERTETHSCDCISRQAAIDIVQGYAEQLQGYIGMPNDSEVYAYARGLLLSIDRNIKALPSAQPDLPIKEKCAFCPHCNNCDVNDDLSIQPCADTISRQAAIEALHDEIVRRRIDEDTNDDGALDEFDTEAILRRLPSAQPEPPWIPCSERLPEDLEEVNVTWVNHSPEPYYDFAKDKPFTASAVYYGGKWFWYSSVCTDILAEYGKNDTDEIDGAIEITAWMPSPEPYRAERRTDERSVP